MAFPTSPVNGQTALINNVYYSYVSATNAWTRVVGIIPTLSNLTVSGAATVGSLTTTGGVFWANGNTALSSGGTATTGNLVGQTSGNIFLTGNVLPTSNIAFDIGSTTQRFKSLYLSGNTIDLSGATIKTDSTTGAIAIVAQPTTANPNPIGIVISPSGTLTTVATVAGEITANNFSAASNTAVASNSTSFSNITVSSGVFWANGTSALTSPADGVITMNQPSTLIVPFTGNARFYPTRTINLKTVYANLGSAPVGANLGFTILKNGANIGYGFTITTSSATMAPVNITSGNISLTTADYLTLNLSGNIAPQTLSASDLSVKITYS